MPVPLVPISTTIPTTVTVGKVFGASYAVVEGYTIAGQKTQVPMQIGTTYILDDYRWQYGQALNDVIQPGANIAVLAVDTGVSAELPMIEILLSNGMTFSEYAIQQGWAIPDEGMLETTKRGDEQVAALIQARALGNGIWGEEGVFQSPWSNLLSSELAEQTQPSPDNLDLLAVISVVATVFVILLCGAHGSRVKVHGYRPVSFLRSIGGLLVRPVLPGTQSEEPRPGDGDAPLSEDDMTANNNSQSAQVK